MKFSTDYIVSTICQYYTGSPLNEIRVHIEQQSDISQSDSATFLRALGMIFPLSKSVIATLDKGHLHHVDGFYGLLYTVR